MSGYLTLAAVGFVGWWATGVDDVLALGLLLVGWPRSARRLILIGNASAVLALLIFASLIVLGVFQFATGLLETRIFGIPLQNLTGIMPIVIGLRAIYELITEQDDNDDEVEELKEHAKRRTAMVAFALGAQVYLINGADDLALHLGILGGVIKLPLSVAALAAIGAYWLGCLAGEGTSILAAHWLANHMHAGRILGWCAALALIGVGVLVVLGVY